MFRVLRGRVGSRDRDGNPDLVFVDQHVVSRGVVDVERGGRRCRLLRWMCSCRWYVPGTREFCEHILGVVPGHVLDDVELKG